MSSRILVAAAVALVAGSCTGDSADRLVGDWRSLEGPETVSFLDDGSVVSEGGGSHFGGRYRFLDERRIEVSFGGPAVYAPPRTYEIAIEDGILTAVTQDGEVSRYRRVE